jgi:hypothetical protein
MAVSELESITALTGPLRTAAEDADVATVAAISEDLAVHASRAASLTSDPVWRLAEAMPWAGANLAALRIASAGVDELTSHVIVPLTDLARSATEAGAASGGFDVAAIAAAQAPLQDAAKVLDKSSAELAAVATDEVIPKLGRGVDELRSMLATAADLVHPLAQASAVVPELLGAEGPRTVLVMVQNNAELRTGGGITGTFVELRAEGGTLTIVDQADSSEFPIRPEPILPIPAALSALYGDVTGRFVQNSSIPADFALTGQLAASWWTSRGGATPDAVISIDPIVLRSLVAVTGPIALPDGSTLTAEDLVQQLLVQPYLTLDSAQQTEYFSQATTAVFARLFAGDLGPLAWIDALTAPIQEGRVSVWSRDAATQTVLAESALGGPAARQRLAGDDAYAVYFNDATGGKLDSFMATEITSGVAECRADGRPEVVVTVTVSSAVPADVEARFPRSMTGGGVYGVALGDIGMVISVSAPSGTYFGGVRKDGELMVSTSGEDAGYPVGLARVNLQPGEVNTLEFRFVTDATRELTPVIVHTPLLEQPTVATATPGCA